MRKFFVLAACAALFLVVGCGDDKGKTDDKKKDTTSETKKDGDGSAKADSSDKK